MVIDGFEFDAHLQLPFFLYMHEMCPCNP